MYERKVISLEEYKINKLIKLEDRNIAKEEERKKTYDLFIKVLERMHKGQYK